MSKFSFDARRQSFFVAQKIAVLAIGIFAITAAGFVCLSPAIAQADTIGPINFEPTTYSVGNINGQDGWLKTGSFDVEVSATSIPTAFGTQSLRMSDAVTSGSFGDQTFAKPLTDSVGETAATAGPYSVGSKQAHFEMQFDIASTQQTEQPGMHVSVSPDRGDGSRMSYVRFEDKSDGIHVFFDDVNQSSACTPAGCANFVETDLATIDRNPHTIKLTLDTIDGPSNDVVKVWIDGVLKHTGTSWEDYYRFDPEANAEQSPRIVKTVLFRESGTANTTDAGKGFLIDNLSLTSGPIPPSTVKVTIDKFIGSTQATAATAQSLAFPMNASWNATNIGAGSGSFSLSTVGFNSPNPYEAVTADMTAGADYSVSEDTTGSTVGPDCSAGKPYMLAGYKTGDTLALAQAATISETAPSFTDLQSDKVVLVVNKPCLPAPVDVSPADGSTVTTATWLTADWTDVTDPFPPITYVYESSNSPATNLDGSFVSPVYVSGTLTTSEIPTTGTPEGTYYWHARAIDADGNMSPWGTAFKAIVDNTPPTFLKVHILKYLDDSKAVTVPDNYQFPMTATWMTENLNGGVESSGNYVLGNNHGGAEDLYGADTASMQAPANYTTSEITDETSQVVPADGECAPGKYQLVGYSTSPVSFAEAVTQATTTAAPVFTDLTNDQYVIVWNRTCPTTGSLTVQKNTNGGNSTFNFSGNLGNFSITTTDGTGSYTFSDLTPGTYTITENSKKGWTMMDNECAEIVVTAGQSALCTVTNTSNRLLGEIRGTKFEDWNGNGKLSNDDHHRLAGWTIYLDTNNNGILDSGERSTVTDSHGNYRFGNLPAGTYYVREVGQSGWIQTVPASGVYTITLPAGKIAKHKDFGNFKLGIISGMKYNDVNGNRHRDQGEVGLSDWTIQLIQNGHVTLTTTTDEDGNYSFSNLGPGMYKIREVQKPGWMQTTHNPHNVWVRSGTISTNNNFGNRITHNEENID